MSLPDAIFWWGCASVLWIELYRQMKKTEAMQHNPFELVTRDAAEFQYRSNLVTASMYRDIAWILGDCIGQKIPLNLQGNLRIANFDGFLLTLDFRSPTQGHNHQRLVKEFAQNLLGLSFYMDAENESLAAKWPHLRRKFVVVSPLEGKAKKRKIVQPWGLFWPLRRFFGLFRRKRYL